MQIVKIFEAERSLDVEEKINSFISENKSVIVSINTNYSKVEYKHHHYDKAVFIATVIFKQDES